MFTEKNIVEELEKRDFKVEVKEYYKNGTMIKGLSIGTGNIRPCFPISDLLNDLNNGKPMEFVIEKISEACNKSDETVHDLFEKVKDNDYVTEHIYIGIQQASDEPLIKRASEFEGIEQYLYVILSETDNGVSSVKVKEHLLSDDKDLDFYWKKAEENTFKETRVVPMRQALAKMTDTLPDDICNNPPMYVISNDKNLKGASAVLNKKVLKNLADGHKVDRLYMLPSSIHECIVIPYDEKYCIDEFTLMVKEVNATQLLPEDILSDRAYLLAV